MQSRNNYLISYSIDFSAFSYSFIFCCVCYDDISIFKM